MKRPRQGVLIAIRSQFSANDLSTPCHLCRSNFLRITLSQTKGARQGVLRRKCVADSMSGFSPAARIVRMGSDMILCLSAAVQPRLNLPAAHIGFTVALVAGNNAGRFDYPLIHLTTVKVEVLHLPLARPVR